MIKKGYVLLVGWILLAACEDPVLIQFLNPDLIFPRAVKIDVPPYHYTGIEDTIYVYGDSLFTIDSVCDTVNNTPLLKWQKTNAPFIVAAIFNELPETSNNNKNITNKNSIVWIWHSGLTNNGNNTDEGNVHYEEGRSVVDMENEIFKDVMKPLDSNTVYYWGVWGWNKEGTEVKFSTRPQKMYVD